MKTRDGFVSNSSSSSFMCITTKDVYDEVYKKSSDSVKKVIDYILENQENNKYIEFKKFLGRQVVVFMDMGDAGGCTGVMPWLYECEDLNTGEDSFDEISEGWDGFLNNIARYSDTLTANIGYG
jgi:hypothetical protein